LTIRTDFCPTCGGGNPPPGEEKDQSGGAGGEEISEPNDGGGQGDGESGEQSDGGGGGGGGSGDQQGEGDQSKGGSGSGGQQGEGGDKTEGSGGGGSEGIYEGQETNCGGGSGSGGKEIEGELGNPEEVGDSGITPEEGEILRRKIARDIISHGKEVGNMPGGLYEWADDYLKPKIDWRRHMKSNMNRAIDQAMGNTKPSWSAVDRRSQPGRRPRTLRPGYFDPKINVAVVVDTSGSMSGDDIAQALGEVQGMLKSRAIAGDAVTVLTVSSHVADCKKVSNASQVKVMERGGTDMTVGVDHAAALKPRPQVTIVLTDGYTPWNKEKPKGMNVVAGIIGTNLPTDEKSLKEKFKIPGFIASVPIPSEDLQK
jgi:hypothetical protein